MASLIVWSIFLGTFVLSIVAVEAGYRWAREKQNVEEEAPVGGMVGAVLGLLAFLLAVTFSFAADRYIARKRAVIDEANAIRTCYMRTAFVAEPSRSEVRKILRQYVDQRLHWVNAEFIHPSRSAAELLQSLSAHAMAVGQANPSSETTAMFVEAVNRVEELHHERLMVRERTRIPGAFWAVLYVVAFLALAAMGYHCGVSHSVRSPVMVSVAIAFASVIVLIADLDRPTGGLVRVNQQAMVDLRDSLSAQK